MECNECEKEVASIYMVCPDCFDVKDKEIAALRAQLADREERLALWHKAKGYIIWMIRYGGEDHVQALKDKGEI